ncbi:TonB-dependent receptor [Dyadobacter sp. NIV53]|uniref:SusC/RagA family TonB-linked outer membrane protein n=1 Tax=Dyadobacter sp. NIV53 TaxID=2861765 RepID=UPI001C887F81|nr:TonB-dependent receptor [Dyadobacter sp. NIV53]
MHSPEAVLAAISGTVVDHTNAPLPGASIVLKGTSKGVVTDADGNFSIQAEIGDILVISFIGTTTQEISIKDGSKLKVTLIADATMLGGVVVVGYGTQKKSEITSSIAKIDGKDIQTTIASNVALSLQGRASGVEIVSSGLPGKTPSIRIRGVGTINNTQPLIVLDGVPVSADILGQLAPAEIESIEILKDAASGAIYGTRAANGVVLVTSKKSGFNQKTTVRLNTSVGFNKLIKKYPVLNAEKLYELKRERYVMDGLPIDPNSPWADEKYNKTRADWQNEMFRTGLFTDYNVNIGGGSENSTINASIFYRDEEGTLLTTNMKRLGMSLRSTQKISDRLRIEENVRISSKKNLILQDDLGEGTSTTIYSAYRFMPSIPVKNDDGSYGSGKASTQFGDMWNPVYKAKEEWWRTNEIRTIITTKLDFDVTKSLTLSARASYQRTTAGDNRFQNITPDQSRSESAPTLISANTASTTKLGEVFANYDKTIGDHHIGATFGISGQIDEGNYNRMIGQGFASTIESQLVMNNAATTRVEGSEYPTTGIASAFFRGTYGYKDKYYFSGIFRADGSSRFADGNRWGYFPSVSAGWRISNESFLAGNTTISNMKLNVGWGQLGNQNVDAFQYLNVYQKDVKYVLGGTNLTGTRLASFANTNITWETTSSLNVLLELGLFNNKLNMDVAYFDKRTKNMLIPLPSLLASGTVSIPDFNAGEMRNYGFEIEPSYNGQIGKVNFDLGLNLTYLQNEVTQLYGEAKYISSNEYNRTYQGQAVGTFYGWKTDGIYQNQAAVESDPNISKDPRKVYITPGDVRFVDINGDNMVDDKDRVKIGNPNPKVLLGFNLGVTYKGFNLSTVFSGSLGHQLYDAMMVRGIDPTQSGNMDAVSYERWTGEGSTNKYPRMSTIRANNNYRVSELGIKSGDYVRMKDATLGYSVPESASKAIGISRLRVYLSGRNLLTFTKFDGVDPEESGSDNLNRGVILNNTPQSKSLVLGLDITF